MEQPTDVARRRRATAKTALLAAATNLSSPNCRVETDTLEHLAALLTKAVNADRAAKAAEAQAGKE